MAQLSTSSPLGSVVLTVRGNKLVGCHFGAARRVFGTPDEEKTLKKLTKTLRAYFDGDHKALTKATTAAEGTPFQKLVWKTLTKIRPGQTRTYSEVASLIGKPKAARAVGTACKSNPICLFIPCHRVTPKSGEPGRYAGGAARKRQLLQQESSSNPIRSRARSAR